MVHIISELQVIHMLEYVVDDKTEGEVASVLHESGQCVQVMMNVKVKVTHNLRCVTMKKMLLCRKREVNVMLILKVNNFDDDIS